MEQHINLPANDSASKVKISVIQKLNFFDDPETDIPLSNGIVLLIYLSVYIAFFSLVLVLRLIIKWNKNRVQACSDLSRHHINECYWCLNKTCCCWWWCYRCRNSGCCYCPVYLQIEDWISRVFWRSAERDVDSSDTCSPCGRLSCGCQKPSCKAIGCLCCVIQCRRKYTTDPTLETTPTENIYIV